MGFVLMFSCCVFHCFFTLPEHPPVISAPKFSFILQEEINGGHYRRGYQRGCGPGYRQAGLPAGLRAGSTGGFTGSCFETRPWPRRGN